MLSRSFSFFMIRLFFYESQAGRVAGIAAHDRYAGSAAFTVVVVNTFRRTCHRGIHAVICGNEIACRLEFGTAFGFVWRIRHAVGAIAYVYAFTATAVSFVVAAFFESAFEIFHNFLRYSVIFILCAAENKNIPCR